MKNETKKQIGDVIRFEFDSSHTSPQRLLELIELSIEVKIPQDMIEEMISDYEIENGLKYVEKRNE